MTDSILQSCAAEAVFTINEKHDTGPIPALLQLLVRAGDLTQDLADASWYEPQSAEHGVVDFFHPGGITRVNRDGSVDQFPN